MTYRDLFERVKDRLDDKVIIADDGNSRSGEATLLFVEKDSRLGAEVAQDNNVTLGYPFLIL